MPDDLQNSPEHSLPAPLEQHLLPAPGHDRPPADAGGSNDSALALRMLDLYNEHSRLRARLEELEKKGEKNGDDGKEGEGDDKQKGGKGEEDGGSEDKKKQEDPAAKRRKRTQFILWGAIGLIFLLTLTAFLLWYLSGYENTDDAFVDGHTDPISTRIAGTVANVYVENTSRVKKGQLLLELDRRDNEIAKKQADANYSQARAAVRAQQPQVPVTTNNQNQQSIESDLNVIRAEAQLQQNEKQYVAAVSNLHQAEANQANAEREEKRYRQLVEKDETSREQYDQRLTARDAQSAQVAAQREQAEAAKRVVEQTEAQIKQARSQAQRDHDNTPRQIEIQRQTLAQRIAQVASSKAQADQAELNLEYTRIYAPEDGIIGDKQVQVDSRVTAGQELFALTQTNDIWVTANFKETQIRKMRKGQSVRIHVDALGDTFDGYVEDLPGASGAVYSLLPPENATGNYVKVVQRLPVRIRFKPDQQEAYRLAPGMSVEPKVLFR